MNTINTQICQEVADRLRELEPWDNDGDIEIGDVLSALGVIYGYTFDDVHIDWVQWLADLIEFSTHHNEKVIYCQNCKYGQGINVGIKGRGLWVETEPGTVCSYWKDADGYNISVKSNNFCAWGKDINESDTDTNGN